MRLVCVEYAHKQLNIAEVEAGKNFPTDCNHVRDFLNALPVIDAVPVVRCVNCIHYGAEASAFDAWTPFCLKHKLTTFPDDFCSYGERKDGDGNG